MSPKIIWTARACAVAAIFVSGPAVAQTADVIRQLNDIKRQMREARDTYQRKIDALESRIKSLESQKTAVKAPPRPGSAPSPVAAARKPATPPARKRPTPTGTIWSDGGNSFQVGLSTSVAAGGSSAGNDVLANLQRGDHDPARNGFTLQSAELFLGGTVDPFFDAQANISLKIDGDGETVVELEDAFFTTRSLPYGLQVKGGQFYTAFGRANPMHLHSWDFVDQPVILSRLFGPDGLRSQGAQVSWLTPLPWFSELTFGLQNSRGETAVSFLGESGEDIGGFTLADRNVRNFGDLLYSARWLNGFDVSDTVSVNLGLSGATGPNATGSSNRTFIAGADIYAKWQPERSERGFPFFAIQAEALYRDYEGGAAGNPARDHLSDWGAYTQALWGFAPGWAAGLRLGYADSEGGTSDKGNDPIRDGRWRLSPNITWFPSEFSKVRLQYNRDWAEHLDNTQQDGGADTLWLQVEFSLGGHFAHKF